MLVTREMIQFQYILTDFNAVPPKVSALDERKHQRKCIGFELFLEQQKLRICWPISYTTEEKKTVAHVCEKISIEWHIYANKNKENQQLYQVKKMDQSMWRSRTHHVTKAPSAVLAQYSECIVHFYTLYTYFLKNQSENKKLSWSV